MNDLDKFKQEMEELKPGDGVQVGDTKYEYGADLDSDKAVVMDPGEGKNVSIRTYEYKMNPQLRGQPVDKQAIFNAHSKEIMTFLWADGLRPLEEHAPRVIIDNKRGIYKIFVVCEGKSGAVFVDTPKNLSEELIKSQKGKLEPSR